MHRGSSGRLVVLVALVLFGCAGTPPPPVDTQTEPPPSTPAQAESQATPEPTDQPAPTAPVEESPVVVAVVPPEPPGDNGTPIVLPNPRERAIQAALAEAQGLVRSGDPDSLKRALEILAPADPAAPAAVTHPDGAALAQQALDEFRRLAPARLPELIPYLTRTPSTADTYSALGRASYMTGNLEQAERASAAGLTMDPLRIDLLLLRAQTLVATDRWLQARTPLESVLRAEPDNADAMVLQATILWRYQRDVVAATETIQNAFAVHPEDSRLYELQGYILYEQGQRDQARQVLEALLQRDPGQIAVSRFLLTDAVDRGAWQRALELLSQVGAPETIDDLLLAQRVYRGIGDRTRDLQTAQRLDELSPDRRYAPIHARSLIDGGRPADAADLIAGALTVSRDGAIRSELYYLRALASGEPFTAEAVRDLQLALAESAANVDAMLAMARHFQVTGQPAKALQYARSALRYRPDDPALIELLRLLEPTPEQAPPATLP